MLKPAFLDACRAAVESAERMSGVTIDDVWASFGAGGLVLALLPFLFLL